MTNDFIHVCNEHLSGVYGYLAYRLGSRADAEHLTEVTFERAMESWSDAPSPSAGARKTWLLKLARSVVADYGRIADADAARRRAEEDPAVSPEVAEALEHLGRRERTVVALRFGGGLKTDEIAEVLDMSPASSRRLLSLGLRRVRTELQPGSGRERSAAGDRDRGDAEEGEAGADQDQDLNS
jgi:RNA polymerase sigma-70 factor (ECF subfamily)